MGKQHTSKQSNTHKTITTEQNKHIFNQREHTPQQAERNKETHLRHNDNKHTHAQTRPRQERTHRQKKTSNNHANKKTCL